METSLIARSIELAGSSPTDDNPCPYAALIIVDSYAQIKFSFWSPRGDERSWLLCETQTKLNAPIEARVRELAKGRSAATAFSDIVLREGGMILRLSHLEGQEEFFALVLERDRNDGKMERAVSRFQLTRRQTEVLGLLLEGASASDVARKLVISEYTAQGYVKCLLTKTASRNRAEMVAKVLDWKSSPASAAAASKPFARARAS